MFVEKIRIIDNDIINSNSNIQLVENYLRDKTDQDIDIKKANKDLNSLDNVLSPNAIEITSIIGGLSSKLKKEFNIRYNSYENINLKKKDKKF